MTGDDNLSDSDVIFRVLAGDVDIYSQIVERYEAKLMRYATFILKDYDVASDLTQETFIKAYENLRGFNQSKQFSPWIYRILHNGAMNYIKRSKKSVSLAAVNEVDDSFFVNFRQDKLIDKDMLNKKVRACLGKIDVKYREVLMLNYFDKLPYDTISEVLRIPKSTVGVRIGRGKKLLKKICQQEGVKYE